jgi:hypothetical protein
LLSANVAERIAVSDLTVRNAGGGSGLSSAVDAGLAAPLTLTRLAIVDNAVTGLFQNGGVVELVRSLVARNIGRGLGGVASSNNQTVMLIDNSTIAQNTALDPGAAARIAVAGGLSNIGGTVVVDSTIAGNRVAAGVFSLGGDNVISQHATDSSIAILRMANTLVADPGRNGNCGGDVQSAGHNLDSDNTCGFHASNDRPGVDALLGPLGDNGGPTDTRALLEGSPAIDAGAGCAATDQRGVARPAGGGCDIGAFESPFTAPLPVPPSSPPSGTTTTPPATPADTTPAKLTVSGVGKTVKRATFNKGLKVKIGADEPISAELILLATPRKVAIAKLPVVALASASLSKAGGTRTVTLKPSTKVKGKRKVKMQLRVVAFDGAGNRSAKTLSFTVR